MICLPLLQSSISCANSDRRSQIEKHVVVRDVRSNLPQKRSTVLSGPNFGPPNKNPGSTPGRLICGGICAISPKVILEQ